MTPKHLYHVIIDVDKIQEFIFESPLLKHIAGASILIAYLTSQEFCYENKILDKNNKVKTIAELTGSKWLEIYFGGGNLKLLFATQETAMDFLRAYQLRFYCQLESASFTSIIYEIDTTDVTRFEKGLETAEKELTRLKQGKLKSINEFANPVFEICHFCRKRCCETKYQIYDQDERVNKSACRDCCEKHQAEEKNFQEGKYKDTLLGKFFNQCQQQEYSDRIELIKEFNDFRKGEGSFLGIVTIDGNRFGEKLKSKINEQMKKETPGNKVDYYIKRLNDFSKEISDNTLAAILETLKTLGYEEKILFRPIIIGGDDICYVMDGRLALPFTEKLLKVLENKFAHYDLTFAAGIAIVKPHFPFFVAHRLAEALLKNVKRVDRDYSGLDFEVVFTSTVENLEQMRKNKYEYTLDNQTYMTTLRPYFLENKTKSGQNKKTLAHRFLAPTLGVENRNLLARNKIKQLRSLVRKGETVSTYDFRLMIGRMPREERDRIWKRLKEIYDGSIWLKVNNILYNNFIDIAELNEFYSAIKKSEEGKTHDGH
ncbi:MAG: hypothetical protein MUF15_21705 [Acidobacteria bacterium]|jgi:hypothetical protein|nr:hypothetical protein [Acidobacteriota bacterium]